MNDAAAEPLYRRHPDVVARAIGGETVLVPVKGAEGDLETLFRLNGTGTLLWERLAEERTRPDLLRALVDAYEVDDATAEADLAAFLRELDGAGLLLSRT